MQNRRSFLHFIGWAIAAVFVFVWSKLTSEHIFLKLKKNKTLPLNRNKTVCFQGEYIVINQENRTSVLSSRCTHLGCQINKYENGRLICPCHGSEYDLNGQIAKGPAYKSLELQDFKVSDDGNNIIING